MGLAAIPIALEPQSGMPVPVRKLRIERTVLTRFASQGIATPRWLVLAQQYYTTYGAVFNLETAALILATIAALS
jgi:hypothetical protein